jgi:O-antigen/teichoic acid export membrane protein
VEAPLKDPFETAVILEALGYNDRDARAHGYADLFGFAAAVIEAAPPYEWHEPWVDTNGARQRAKQSSFAGFFSNITWLLLLVTLFMGGHSLWAARDLTPEMGAATGLGVILGLAVSGGVQQFASWKISYYYLQGNLPLVRFVLWRTIIIGAGLLLATAAAGFFIVADGLPMDLAALSAAYVLLVGVYRLSTAPLLGLNRLRSVFAVTLFGLSGMFTSYTFFTEVGMDRLMSVLLSQVVGVALISGSSGVILGFAVGGFRAWSRPPARVLLVRPEELHNVRPPRLWALLFDSLPQLLFGTLFFLFLFADRLVLWVTSPARDAGYNMAYQIGVDTALVMIVPISAIQFPLMRRLSERLEDVALRTGCGDASTFSASVGGVYRLLMVRMAGAAGAICALAFTLSNEIVGIAGGDSSSVGVFEAALVGIFFSALFLSTAAFVMTFRRIADMGALLLVAAVTNVTVSVGFVMLVGPSWAVVGFVVGSLVLALASFAYVASLIRRADHAYYSAA